MTVSTPLTNDRREKEKGKVFNAEKKKVEDREISVESEWSAAAAAAKKTDWTLVLIDLFFGFSL